jgi:hypothetical protein
MTSPQVDAIEKASPLRRGVRVWYATFGGIGAWTVHLVFLASAEHWTYLHPGYGWTLHAATAVCAAATIVALVLARRLLAAASGGDPSAANDAGQLVFLAQFGLLVGAINLALILLEGSYALFISRG